MKNKLSKKSLIVNLMIMLVLVPMAATALKTCGIGNIAAYSIGVALFVAALFAPMPQSRQMKNEPLGLLRRWCNGMALKAGISREIWENHIQETLFPSDSFLEGMLDETEYVNYKTVHSPQAGASTTVYVDPVFPLNSGNGLAVSQRTDTVADWNIHVFFTSPFLITNAEDVELSYNKRESVLYSTTMELRRVIAENLLIYCAPTGTALLNDGVTTNANILRTTGVTNNDLADVRSSDSYLPGTTGKRLNATLYDIRQMKLLFDNQNVAEEDRYMALSPNAKDQILNDLIVTKFRQDAFNVFDVKTGNIDMLMGFKIKMRSKIMRFTNAATPVVKAYGAANAATDNDAILCWQKAALAKAMGDVHVYEQLNSPTQGGDVYSCLIRMGATKKRSSELGVGVIVQTAAA